MASSSDEDENILVTTVTLNCLASGETHTFTRRLGNIGNLKAYIANNYDIPIPRQIIVHQETLMMNDAKEFTDLRDESGRAYLEVYTKMEPGDVQVVVETPTGQLSFQIHSERNITLLERKIDELKGIPPRRQELTVMGVEMDIKSNLVEDYVTITPLQINLTEIPPDPDHFIRVNLINQHFNTSATVEIDMYDTVHTLHGLARRHNVAEGFDFYCVWSCYDNEHFNGEYAKLVGQLSLRIYGVEDGDNVYLNYDDEDTESE